MKTKFPITFILLLTFLSGFAQDIDLIPFRNDTLWGYADTTGKIIIEPKYDWADIFKKGAAKVYLKNKAFYIDRNDQMIVKPLYQYADLFPEYNLLKIRANCNNGYVNIKNDTIVPFIYDDLSSIYKGFIFAKQNKKYFLLDQKGKVIKNFSYDLINFDSPPHNPYTDHRSVMQNGKLGLVDFKGNEVLAPIYDDIRRLWGDTLIVKTNNLYGLITLNGKIILPIEYSALYNFDTILIKKSKSQWLISDQKDNRIFPYNIDSLQNYGQNTFLILNKNKIGLISLDKRINIPPIYDILTSAGQVTSVNQDGNYFVRLNSKCGVIDQMNRVLIPIIYDTSSLKPFNSIGFNAYQYLDDSSKYMTAILNGYYEVIDNSGRQIVPFIYDQISNYSNFIYDQVSNHGYLLKGYLELTKDQKHGIMDENFKEIIPCKYNSILDYVGHGIFRVSTGQNRIDYVSVNGIEFFKD